MLTAPVALCLSFIFRKRTHPIRITHTTKAAKTIITIAKVDSVVEDADEGATMTGESTTVNPVTLNPAVSPACATLALNTAKKPELPEVSARYELSCVVAAAALWLSVLPVLTVNATEMSRRATVPMVHASAVSENVLMPKTTAPLNTFRTAVVNELADTPARSTVAVIL